MIDYKKLLVDSLEGIDLSDQERDDVEATLRRIVDLSGDAIQGANVRGDVAHLQAQVLLWKSGATSSLQSALKTAAQSYAEAAGKVIGKIIEGALGSLV